MTTPNPKCRSRGSPKMVCLILLLQNKRIKTKFEKFLKDKMNENHLLIFVIFLQTFQDCFSFPIFYESMSSESVPRGI
jgi:hypothetical protein